MTIFQSTDKFLFVSYRKVSWSSVVSVKGDGDAYLFTLTNPYNIPPTRYPIYSERKNDPVDHFESSGPCFGKYGSTCDVSVSDFTKDTS